MLNVHGKCGNIDDSKKLFDYNCSEIGNLCEVLLLF